jgi:hypothetical protein
VARNFGKPTAPGPVLRAWAIEQGKLLEKSRISESEKRLAAALLMLFGAPPGDLPICHKSQKNYSMAALERHLRTFQEIEVYAGDEIDYDEDEDDTILPKDFENDFELSDDLFLYPTPKLSIGDREHGPWPETVANLYVPNTPKTCGEAFRACIRKAWGELPDYEEQSKVVGHVHGEEIKREVRVYVRTPDLSEYT